MTKPYFTDENRVQIEDLPSLDFLLHMFVHDNEPPRYIDLLREIQYHSRLNKLYIQEYYMIIQQDDSYKFKFNNDYGLHNALRAITEKSRLEFKLMKMHGKEPFHIIKPIVIRMNPAETVLSSLPSPTPLPMRKDSGISFEQDLIQFNTTYSHKRKLPTLSNIITSPPIHWSPAGSNHKLPSLSYLLDSPQLAPIHMLPLSPVSASASPYSSSTANARTMTYKKRTRGGSVPPIKHNSSATMWIAVAKHAARHFADPTTYQDINPFT
ncbi:S1 motif domain-containing protein [Mucor velutinosus]|uniref:S1 motif domain-containing protein n=1 Tax=Mucor velutinosus TaxID=708070 RepID=A0AAN7HJU9_9FUNG|nr:S1 motif domain-containing protein [Mucor velutinosus]